MSNNNLDSVISLIRALQQTGIINDGPSSPAPTGTSAGGSTAISASGRGMGYDDPELGPNAPGQPMSAHREGSEGAYFVQPRVNANTAANYTNMFGLQGMNLEGELVGLTESQARAKALQLGQERRGQVSDKTSFAFNPQSMANFGNTFRQMQMKLDEIANDAWKNPVQKQQEKESLIRSYSTQFADIFGTQEALQAAMQNPQTQQLINQYTQVGGDVNDIAAEIQKGPDQRNMITIEDYMGEPTTQAEQMASDALFPEKMVAQDKIALDYGIAEEMRRYYFGDEEQIGFHAQQIKFEEERIKILEREAQQQKANIRAQAQFAIERNNAQMAIEENKIEENRQNAKNYVTGMLAKLGALKTTGEAPRALANLEQRYQQQAQQLRTNYDFANREIDMKMNESVNGIAIDRDKQILKIRQDLSLDEQKMYQEVFKLQNAADKNALNVIERYARDFRNLTDKYTKDLKSEAEKFAKRMETIAADRELLDSLSEGEYLQKRGVVLPTGEIKDMRLTPTNERDVASARVQGESTIRLFLAQPAAFRDWYISQVQSGNLRGAASTTAIQNAVSQWEETTKKEEETWSLTDRQKEHLSNPKDTKENKEKYIRQVLKRDPQESVFDEYLR